MRVVGVVGKTLMAAGVLILLFVAYELWGTGLHEATAQRQLSGELEEVLSAAATSTTVATGPTSTLAPKTAPNTDIMPDIGEPVGRLEIPKIHVKKTFVQGADLVQLDRAPGHYPDTPFPGQKGNAAIAGHRTTYGAPFFHVDRLVKGDKIIVTTVQGKFTYSVINVFIVDPFDVWVLDTDKKHPNTLTLTACHPRYDLKERIIVRAVLDGTPVPPLPGQAEAAKQATAASSSSSLADGVDGGRNGALPAAILWGLACVAVWALTWFAARTWRRRSNEPRRHQMLIPYVIGVPVFLGLLFVFYENLAQVVPAGL